MGAGRPFGTFAYTAEELEKEIDAYFDGQDAKEKPYTMTGLALALNVAPQTLVNYGTPGYAPDGNYLVAISRARLRCINYVEERLDSKDGVQGAKFSLCNNSERMGGLKYAERQEISCDIAPITFVDDLAD